MKCCNTRKKEMKRRFKYLVTTNIQYSKGNVQHFGHWFTNSEADPCQTADVQIVDGSDLQAHADLQEWPISGSSDVCWLTAVPKLASWPALLLGLVSFSGTQIWSRPDLFDLLTGFLLRAAVLTLMHERTHTIGRHTHTRTYAWQTGKYFITLCNGRASGYCTLHEKQDYCKVSANWWISFFVQQHKCVNNVSIDLRSRLWGEG